MRTLAVDALRMVGNRTGQGRHVEYLAFEWSRMETPFDRITLMAPRTFELPALGDKTAVEVDVFGANLPLAAWEQVRLPLRARSAAVLFCPTYIGPLHSRAPIVVANHGIYERIPDEFSRLQRLRSTTLHRSSARRADRVIANSKNTRRDVAEFFGVPLDEIDVVYPAANDVFFESHGEAEIAAAVEEVLGTPGPYFIFVGKLSRRRHIPELIEAFARLRRAEARTHRLLIVGPNAIGLDVAGLASSHGVGDAVVDLPHLEQKPLSLLYAGATAFVLPTTYEGISQTMFEAMASKTPVLTVEHPTLDEGAGTAVLTLASPSVDEIYGGLRRLVCDEDLRHELARRGHARATAFSWSKTARQTLEILDRVALSADRDG